MKGKLILEDGSVFEGQLLNDAKSTGEVVFNTAMSGYQEIMTDPSYCNEIVTFTYPMIGNYGMSDVFNQSRQPFVSGVIVGELCDHGSNWQMQSSIQEYLTKNNIACLHGVDTRAVTRKIRSAGTMKGIIVPEQTTQDEIDAMLVVPLKRDLVKTVTTADRYVIPGEGPSVVVMDFGIKKGILDSLHSYGYHLTVVPADTSAEDVLGLQPDGIFLSNGPGNPKAVPEAIETVKALIGQKPMFGICLGHQILALALGADTYKLKFGHRGSNQPVKNLITGRVHISSQNHGYAVDEASLAGIDVKVTHRAVNDGTVEGMHHTKLPIFSVQYHPEASPGSGDNAYLFDEFWTMLTEGE